MPVGRGAQPTNKPKVAAAAKAPPKKGASRQRTLWRHRLNAYWSHHSLTAADSLKRLLQTPLQSLLTWLVVAIAVTLPALLYIALNNVQVVSQHWQDTGQISVFLHKRASTEAVQQFAQTLRQDPRIAAATVVLPDEALREFEQRSGFAKVLDSLDDNPLPAVLLVQPSADLNSANALAPLVQELQEQVLVDNVLMDMGWLQKLYQIMQLAQLLVTSLGLLLSLGVLLVIGNTIRLAIENRRDEILVVKLVGGTDSFVRRPFLYTGFWYGIGGGVLALMILALAQWALSGPVTALADLYHSQYRLQGLGVTTSCQLVLATGVLGLLGAWLAVSRHLHLIEPQ